MAVRIHRLQSSISRLLNPSPRRRFRTLTKIDVDRNINKVNYRQAVRVKIDMKDPIGRGWRNRYHILRGLKGLGPIYQIF